MIRTIRNKALAAFASKGDGSKLPVQNRHHDKVTRILRALDAAKAPHDMNVPGYRFHGLQGEDRYSVDVTRNYRITFGWDEGDAIDVDIEDTH